MSLHSDAVARFQEGICLEDGTRCAPAKLEVLCAAGDRVRVTLHEGLFHQVKRMIACVGGEVVALHRDKFAQLDASEIPPGQTRLLTMDEICTLADLLPTDRVAKRDTRSVSNDLNESGAVVQQGSDHAMGRTINCSDQDGCHSDYRLAKRLRHGE